MPQKHMECFRLLLDHLAWIEHQFLSVIRDSIKEGRKSVRDDERCRKSMESIHQSWLAKGLRLGLLYWGFKGVQGEIPSEEASTLQIGSVEFPPEQCTRPQLNPRHRLFDQDRHKTVPHRPYSPDLAPCDFWYSLSSEAVVMRQLRRWKRLWWRSLTRSHNRTSIGPSRSYWNGTTSALQPEEITLMGTRVSCVYYH